MRSAVNYIVVLLGLITLPAFLSMPPAKVAVVVINAGHGGTDPGCQGHTYKEKDVALKISLRLGKYIEHNLKDVKIYYTRTDDIFVPLNEIAAHANKQNADLFICIHCNASTNKEVYGAETYVMGLHKTKGNLEVAKRENASILFEEDYQTKYEGFDPNSDEANIIFSMYQNAFLDQSLNFAAKVQQEFKKIGRVDKGVKQAGFLVLWKTKMPSVLIETGFLTNVEEEKYLGSQKGQDEIARSIFRAFRAYKAEKQGLDIKSMSDLKPDEISPQKTETVEVPKPNAQLVEKPETQVVETPKEKVPEVNFGEGLSFSVQIAVSNKKNPLNSKRFSEAGEVFEIQEADVFKYLSGRFKSLEEAVEYQKQLRAKGFNDAFLVAFHNGNKITLVEARELMNKSK